MPSAVLAELNDRTPHKDDRKVLAYQYRGYPIVLGRNSFSNEKIIVDHPHRECLWMHAMAARGSHVILCTFGHPEPNDEVIQYAAKLALDHSHSQARTVSVSKLSELFKPDNAGAGVWKTARSASVEVME